MSKNKYYLRKPPRYVSLFIKINGINGNLGGLSFYEDETGKYVVGADAVPKKLGNSGGRLIKVGTVNTTFNAATVLSNYGIKQEDINPNHFIVQPYGGSWSGYINGNRGLSGYMMNPFSASYNTSNGTYTSNVKFSASGTNSDDSTFHAFAISGNYGGWIWYFDGEEIIS